MQRYRSFRAFKDYVVKLWRKTLGKRSQKGHLRLGGLQPPLDHLPTPRAGHPSGLAQMIDLPQVHPEEPTAVTPHGGFCGGKSQQWLRYPTMPHVRFCAGGCPVLGTPTAIPHNSLPKLGDGPPARAPLLASAWRCNNLSPVERVDGALRLRSDKRARR